VTQLLAAGKMTAPSPLGEEKVANPFLRADMPDVATAVGMAGASAAEVFAEIRTRKNKF
jgi:hydroxyacylglutathione hydrolase